jgi:hypothetical protein
MANIVPVLTDVSDWAVEMRDWSLFTSLSGGIQIDINKEVCVHAVIVAPCPRNQKPGTDHPIELVAMFARREQNAKPRADWLGSAEANRM